MHVELPDQYPYKSPSIGFMNKIFHPNIDELLVKEQFREPWSIMIQALTNLFSETFTGAAQYAWTSLIRLGVQCLVSIIKLYCHSPNALLIKIICYEDMINIFESFLPQLLRYPNPTDPLNGEAAALMMREPATYESKVKEYVSRYATREAADAATDESSEEEEMSDVSYSDSDDEAPGMEL